MGKNRSASGLTNVIQYDNNGNITFVSGSTTLMQVSSSGAITTTGVISGSNALSASYALNSALLNGTGSVGFATTGSLLAVSSSQQQISASLLQVSASQQQLSSSFLTLTASFNAVSSSQQQISSSQQQISASLLNVISIFATTGSNSFRATQSITGSLTVTGQIIAQTLNVQQVTSSIIYSSGSNNFGCDLNSRQTFTGSVLITGSLTIAGASSATSYSGTTIYGSTAVCSAVGKFTSCIDVGGTGTFSGQLSATTTNGGTSAIFLNSGVQNSNGIEIRGGTSATAVNWKLEKDNTLSNAFQITPSTTNGGTTFSTPAFTLTSAVACFSGTVCAPNIVATNLTTTNSICLSGVGSLCFFGNGESRIQGPGTGAYIGLYNIGTIQFNSGGTYDIGSSATTARCVFSTKVSATQLLATCLTLNGFSSGNGLKMDYGSASGQITAMNLIANGTTNGFIGIQMVDGSNGDLWLGGSAGRSMTLYRTGNTGLKTDTPCTSIHVEGGYGSRWGGNGCFFGGGVSGGGMPYGDIYGNGASYTYQTCCGNANNSSLYGGFAAGYFKGGPGSAYGGGGAGIVAIGGDGGNAESVNAGGGAGIFARAGKNGAGSAHSYAGWFDGGDVMVRCGSVLSCAPNNGHNFRALGFSTGAIATGGSCLIFSNLDRGLYLISIASSVTSTFGYSAFLWVDSSNITVSSVIRQSCVTISTNGRYLCVVNQYTSETAIMTVTTLNLLNYIG
jgi:hypothetical protein